MITHKVLVCGGSPENEYEALFCPACAKVHLIDRNTGKPLVKRDNQRSWATEEPRWTGGTNPLCAFLHSRNWNKIDARARCIRLGVTGVHSSARPCVFGPSDSDSA
jgi:hypothetical protein